MKRVMTILLAFALLASAGAVAQDDDRPPSTTTGSDDESAAGDQSTSQNETRPDDKPDEADSEEEKPDETDSESEEPDQTDSEEDKPDDSTSTTSDEKPEETDDADDQESDESDRDDDQSDCEGERADCISAYCEAPADADREKCQEWEAQQEREEKRQAAKTTFSSCKESADKGDGRKECTRQHNLAVRQDDDEKREQREISIAAARDAKKIGARAAITAGLGSADAAVEEYDISLIVESDNAMAAGEAADLRITVSAELEEGRTIVLDIDPALLSGPDLVIRYFDVNDDGTETEVIIREASDLVDVLDATDDAGQPEFWIVSDSNGLQVLATIPHWSVHAITVQGVGEFVTSPSVIAGVVAGVLGTVLATTVLFWPRRQVEVEA